MRRTKTPIMNDIITMTSRDAPENNNNINNNNNTIVMVGKMLRNDEEQ